MLFHPCGVDSKRAPQAFSFKAAEAATAGIAKDERSFGFKATEEGRKKESSQQTSHFASSFGKNFQTAKKVLRDPDITRVLMRRRLGLVDSLSTLGIILFLSGRTKRAAWLFPRKRGG